MSQDRVRGVAVLFLMLLAFAVAPAADWPMLGRDQTRNSASPESGGPLDWKPGQFDVRTGERLSEDSRNVKWGAKLGTQTSGDPVVANGLVWVGTNNHSFSEGRPDASVLMCFRESDGELLYKYVSPRIQDARIHDWPYSGMTSSPLIEGDRLWFVTNRWEVVCLDIGGLASGAGDATVLWKLDLINNLGVFPRVPPMGWLRRCSPAGYKDWLYVITGNGVGEGYVRVAKPEAPSLLCIEKATGKVVWSDNSPGENILYGQWTSPLVMEIGGRAQCVAPQGDGWVRSFDAETGELLWEFDINAKESVWRLTGQATRNLLVAAPVYYDGLIYIASGQHPEALQGPGRLVCIDPMKKGDISSELAVDANGNPLPRRRVQAVDPSQGERAVPNPNSGLVWQFTRQGEEDFLDEMHTSVSSAAATDGLVIAADYSGAVHCLDAKTGRKHWSCDLLASSVATPLLVDRKIYVADEDGEVAVFRLSRDPLVAMRPDPTGDPTHVPLAEIEMGGSVYCSPIFANGVLYLATQSHLFAIGEADANRPQRQDPQASNQSPRGKAQDAETARTGPRSVFVPTPEDVVEKMLEIADIKRDDLVVDLGSGDGRIVIAAAKKYGSSTVGYEIDAELVAVSRAKAKEAGVEKRVTIGQKDIFRADLSQADVVAVYLVPTQLEELMPQLEKLRPGSRIVSHEFGIPGMEPDQTLHVTSAEDGAEHTIYLWTAPLKPQPRR